MVRRYIYTQETISVILDIANIVKSEDIIYDTLIWVLGIVRTVDNDLPRRQMSVLLKL